MSEERERKIVVLGNGGGDLVEALKRFQLRSASDRFFYCGCRKGSCVCDNEPASDSSPGPEGFYQGFCDCDTN